MTKTCTVCLHSKCIDEFYIKRVSKVTRVPIYHSECKSCARVKAARHYQNRVNRNDYIARQRVWNANNKDKARLASRKYNQKPHRKLQRNLRHRLKKYLRKIRLNLYRFSCSQSVGCKYQELQKILETKFLPGMTWDNYGTEWHVDHIRPLSSFDLSDAIQRQQANHFSNLQPLWAEDNIKKGAKY